MTEEEFLMRNLSIYRNEIWSITNSILKMRDQLFKTETFILCGDKENFVFDCDSEPHELIATILSNAGRLQKLFTVANKREDESDVEFEFRKERAKKLRKFFLGKGNGTRELFKTSSRNSLEHFDERTDLLMRKIIEDDFPVGEKLILYNMTINYTNVFTQWELVLPIKVFVTESLEYFTINPKLQKESVSLDKIFKESEKINEKVKLYIESNYTEESPERGGPNGFYISINQEK